MACRAQCLVVLMSRGAPLCLLLVALITQPEGKAQQHNFFAYGEGSGLSNLNATTLLQDRDGLLWAGTQSGIFTADGPRFDKQKAFTDAGFESIRAMREDSAGTHLGRRRPPPRFLAERRITADRRAEVPCADA